MRWRRTAICPCARQLHGAARRVVCDDHLEGVRRQRLRLERGEATGEDGRASDGGYDHRDRAAAAGAPDPCGVGCLRRGRGRGHGRGWEGRREGQLGVDPALRGPRSAPCPRASERAADIPPGDAYLQRVGTADQSAASRPRVLVDQPAPGTESLELAVLDQQLQEHGRGAGAVAANGPFERRPVVTMLVEDERAWVVDDAVAGGEQAGEDVRVAAGEGLGAGVELGGKRLGYGLQQRGANRHVGADAGLAGVQRGHQRPVEDASPQAAGEARLPFHARTGGRVEPVGERRPGQRGDQRVVERLRELGEPVARMHAVVVGERDHLAASRAHAGVAGVVETLAVLAHVAKAVFEHGVATVALAGGVVDDDHLQRRRVERREPGERGRQLCRAAMRAEHDRAAGGFDGGFRRRSQPPAQTLVELVAAVAGLDVGPDQRVRERGGVDRTGGGEREPGDGFAAIEHEQFPPRGRGEVERLQRHRGLDHPDAGRGGRLLRGQVHWRDCGTTDLGMGREGTGNGRDSLS